MSAEWSTESNSSNENAFSLILAQTKVLLGFTDENTQPNAVLELMVRDAMNAALCYCHRKYVTYSMAIAIRSMVLRRYGAENGDGSVASVKRGDTTVTYTDAISADSLTDQEKNILNAFRRVLVR